MSAPLEHILADLEALVAFDTRNPPRDLTVEAPLFRWLNDRVPGFTTEVLDFGDGCLGWYARRGETETLFNVHLDTVPVAPGWTRDPFTLLKGDDRATGLGACDIKGAAACLLSVAEATDAPMAFLFTTDEEAGKSDAVHGFLRTDHPYNRVIVAEPTEVQAVPQHRGIISAEVQFSGTSGHASGGGASAVHAAAAFVTKALGTDWAKENRLNFGRIEGGVKPNMVAADCLVRFGFRGLPGADTSSRLKELQDIAGSQVSLFEKRFEGPPLPVADPAVQQGQIDLMAWATAKELTVGEPVHFWTEASLFAAGGYPALVLGPGNIAQAHTADEYVHYADLSAAFEAYSRIVSHG